MLSINEKKLTGAEYEISYKVPVNGVHDAITVVLLIDKDLIVLSRGMSIRSPIEKSHIRNGYRRAKGRAIIAITEGYRSRDKASIVTALRAMDPTHPVHEAIKIGNTKIDPLPLLTKNEIDMVEALDTRILAKKHSMEAVHD